MLSIGSEPLTSPHFAPILDLASRHGVPELGFYTNGLLMKERIVEAILGHGVTVVVVSVDGATKRTYEAIRRGADFDVLLRNVERLVRRRAALGRSLPKIRFGVVLMRSNVEELEDIVTLAWRMGAEELNFFHMVAYDGLGMERESLVHHKALSNRCLERAIERAREVGLSVVHAPKPFALGQPPAPGRSRAPAAGPFTSTPYCRFPFFHVAINAGGQLLPCPFSHGEAAYGVVSDETSFESIWLGPRFMELRRRILAGDPPAMCRRCSLMASTYPDVPAFFEPRASTARPA
jgi:MoaA/NifB/PqqE/SkfB family radical SAM enzyme